LDFYYKTKFKFNEKLLRFKIILIKIQLLKMIF